ncbi:MAG TPA: AraC family transcriptional regulator [bacterium]|jgi:AraC-like DNA-binding protein|nr:AraC family transcriptional regulator [bacterium]
MDPLTEIFSSMNIKRAIFDKIEMTAPWGFRSTCSPDIKFALVLNGSGVMKIQADKNLIPLSGGDVFIILDDSEFSISDKAGSKTIDCADFKKYKIGNIIQFGGGGSLTTFVVGRFEISQPDAKPILDVLPKFLHLKLNKNRTHSFQSVLELLALETEQPGLASESMINRFCEMLFIHAIRVHTNESPQGNNGWLAGLTDRQLGVGIRSIHDHLEKNWTVESMAACAGMSRSAFAFKFKTIVGQSPLEYLTRWRMHKASALIRQNHTNFSEISHVVGYESESAFTKAFKREMGETPSKFRKRQSTK